MSDNTVTMNLSSYNQIKAENTRFQMFISRLFEDAELRADYSGIEFDTHKVEDLIHLVYPDMYKKKLSALRTQQTKMSIKELNLNKPKEEKS
jgi:hypothetical protein